MKVYFAAPMRGERKSGEIYRKIFFVLERMGCKVITPHVVDESGRAEEGLSDEEIFERDMKLINECDVLVAEVSTPSIGVGVEIQSALDRGKPVICLYLPEARKGVSALVLGNPNIVKIEYTPDTVEEKLLKVLGK
ncbi:MAG: nucleoside 2-deoxyribosyltransferase, partial [Nitrososphaerota archaeon]